MELNKTLGELKDIVLIRAPFGKDADHLASILEQNNFSTQICENFQTLSGKLFEYGLIVTTEEVLATAECKVLEDDLNNQPSWSNIPIVTFYASESIEDPVDKKAGHPLQKLAGITFVKRPVTVATLVKAVDVARNERQRQYQLRSVLQRLQNEISQKEKFQAELTASQKREERARVAAENASKSKSQFLANMSHEIRTPLGAIMGFLELLRDHANNPTDIENYISVIARNSSHLLRLIDDILDLSKVEAGQMPIEAIEFSLSDIIADITSLMGFKAREKGVFFFLKIDGQLPTKIISDPTRLRQILTNILSNSIKFTERGRVDLEVSIDGHFLVMRVQDTGTGISEEAQIRLFQPFVQGDDSITRHFGGTGLGLVLTRHLTEAMGGSFILEKSEPGVGSTFVAKLQIQMSENANSFNQSTMNSAVVQKTETKNVLDGVRILVVEDSPDNQALFNIILSKVGARIEIAENGLQGVERALNESFDLILMDVQMPEMDGHEATKLLRSKGLRLPIIALTAHAMKEEQAKTKQSGFDDFLTKPIERKTLISTVQKYAKRKTVNAE